jgi:homoserine kinase
MNQSVSIRVPATSANMGPGFDSFGLAVAFYNRFTFSLAEQDGISIADGTCIDTDGLSLSPQDNLIFTGIEAAWQAIGQGKARPGVHVAVEGHIPMASGLGSSSSAIVGGLIGTNHLFGQPLSTAQLCELATDIEGHPDNVVPAITGGVVLCDDYRFYPLDWPNDWRIAIVTPQSRLSTKEARECLPDKLPMADAIFNLRKASMLTYALLKHDEDAFRQSLDDRLHQPYRSRLIPDFERLHQLLVPDFAFGVVISGAGPSLAIFYHQHHQQALQQKVKGYLAQQEKPSRLMLLDLDTKGAHLVGN